MKEISISCASGRSRVLVGMEALEACSAVSAAQKIIVADEEVLKLHRQRLPDWPVIAVKGGEDAKSLSGAERLYSEFLKLDIDRSSFVLGVGGGTVCDVTGFAAATYMRGVRLGLIPTTLLAQVDASIGGKNGVNFGGFKNQIGTFRQPELVVCDPAFLGTVPEREIRSGYAEVIKAAAIADASLLSYLEENADAALRLEAEVVERALYGALSVKTRIVESDEAEKGERMKLNFGHTIGHAVESTQHIPHGEAVSIGMVTDLMLSKTHLGLDIGEVSRVKKLLHQFGLPVVLPGEREELAAALLHDKKRRGGHVLMALLKKLGEARIVAVEISELEGVLDDMCMHR